MTLTTSLSEQHVPTTGFDPDFHPDCTVRYDPWTGCGVNVTQVGVKDRRCIELVFVTEEGFAESHELTFDQVVQLRAALDAVTRENRPGTWRRRAGETIAKVSSEAAFLAGRTSGVSQPVQAPSEVATA